MPNLIDRIAASLGYTKEKPNLPAWYLASAEVNMYGGIPDPSIYANQADFYRKLSWINIAVNLVSYEAATATCQVKKLEEEKAMPIKNHPFEKLLRRPNPEQSRFDFFQHIYAYLLLTGNSYVHIIRSNELSEPMEVWVIPTPNIKPILSKRMGVDHYEYNPGYGAPIILPKYEVLHIKTFNPNQMFVGLSPIESVGTVAHGDLKMQEWNTNFFDKQNAKIPGALAFKDNIDTATWEKLKLEVQESWGGTGRYGPMLLRNVGTGVNWVQTGMTQSDLDFIAGRNMNRDEIFSVYAPGLLSMISPDSTEANARIGKATFTEFTLWPLLTMLAEKFTNEVLPSYGENLTFVYDDIRVTDNLVVLKQESQYSETHTIDEIRKKYYDDKPIGDERGKMLPAELKKPSGFGASQALPERQHQNSGDVTQPNGRVQQELKAWRSFELKRLGKKSKRDFECEFLPPSVQEITKRELAKCANEADIEKVFDYAETLLILV